MADKPNHQEGNTHNALVEARALLVESPLSPVELENLRKRTVQMIQLYAPLAVQTLVRAMREPLPKDSISRPKIDAAKTLLAIAGYVAPKAGDAPADRRALEEMTADQLREFIGQAERAIADRARVVIDGTQAAAQATDLFD
jgi:hypothetical protein